MPLFDVNLKWPTRHHGARECARRVRQLARVPIPTDPRVGLIVTAVWERYFQKTPYASF